MLTYNIETFLYGVFNVKKKKNLKADPTSGVAGYHLKHAPRISVNMV